MTHYYFWNFEPGKLEAVLHSKKIPMIQQGYIWGVSSIGNPAQASTGFNFLLILAKAWTKC